MANQWEMCEVLYYDDIWFYTFQGYKVVGHKAFIESRHKQASSSSDVRPGQVICLLFSEGWEPFALREGGHAFRRKYQN